jgi:hypothetical protein
MGSSADGILAYGFNLGGDESGWEVREANEFGGLELDWFDPDEDDGDAFTDAAKERLLAAAGFTETDWAAAGYFDREREAELRVGVTFEHHGYEDYILAARRFTVGQGDTKTIDPAALASNLADADTKLTAALATLGITPKQEKPAWLLCASYG